MIPPDPRLADPVILALAAKRALARQADPPKRKVVLQIQYYDSRGIDPPEWGEVYTYWLPLDPRQG